MSTVPDKASTYLLFKCTINVVPSEEELPSITKADKREKTTRFWVQNLSIYSMQLFLLLFIYLFFRKPMSTTLARVACSVAIGEEKEVGNMSKGAGM